MLAPDPEVDRSTGSVVLYGVSRGLAPPLEEPAPPDASEPEAPPFSFSLSAPELASACAPWPFIATRAAWVDARRRPKFCARLGDYLGHGGPWGELSGCESPRPKAWLGVSSQSF